MKKITMKSKLLQAGKNNKYFQMCDIRSRSISTYLSIWQHLRREGERRREKWRKDRFHLLFLCKLPSHPPMLTKRREKEYPQSGQTHTVPVNSLTAQDWNCFFKKSLPWHQKREVDISFPFVQSCVKIQKQASPSPDSNEKNCICSHK